MKRYLFFISAAILAISCEKEIIDTQKPVDDTEYKTITFESVITKTTLDEDGTVKWEEGDEISIYYIKDNKAVGPYSAIADASGITATFTAEIPAGDNPDAYYAAYPAKSGNLADDGTFSINIDASKCDGTFKKANFAAAYSTTEAMAFQFKNAAGIIRFAVPKGGVITRANGNIDYPITGIYVRGKRTSGKFNGAITVNISDNAVSGFGDSAGAGNINMTSVSSEALNDGFIYVPCTPVELEDGICVRFYSSTGNVPAVLSKDDKAISVERGHILPIGDITGKVAFDYYVSATGNGDGLSSTSPMSIESMQSLLNTVTELHPTLETKMQFPCYHLNGTTFNLLEGEHTVSSTITIPAGSTNYRITIDGGNNAVLTGSNVKVFTIGENATIKNLTIQGADVSSLSGANANGAGVTVNAQTKVTLENVTIQNCNAKSGGAIFVAYNTATATDSDSVLDCINCKFISNTSTGNGGAIITAGASKGGTIRFDGCYFKGNGTTTANTSCGGTLYSASPVLALFNKCTFYENTSKKYAQDIYMDAVTSRLAINNCTFRGAARNSNQGSTVTTRGYSIIANSTFWSTGAVGPWGIIGLGSNTSNADANGSIVVNCFINNKPTTKNDATTSYPAFYFNIGFYQNVQYCIYTGDNDSDEITTDTKANNTNLGTGATITGAGTKSNTSGNDPYYYAYTWPWENTYTCPTLAQVRSIIASNTQIGQTFLDWLDTIEGSLSTDIAGRERPANAMCPGSYQQENVTANGN